MKARTKTTRWLLIALLFGLLAATGLTLTLHHGAVQLAKVHDTAAPHPAPSSILPTAIGTATQTLTASVGAGPDREVVDNTDVTSPPPRTTGGETNTSKTSASPDTAWSNHSNGPAADGDGGGRQGNAPSPTSTPGAPAQNGAGDYAYNSYAPLDCELPAGCGVPGGTGYVSRLPSGASGEVPTHDSASPTTDGSGAQTNNTGDGDPPPGNSDTGNSDPGTPKVHSAPELDPATLAGAVTLLLGALAILRSRRARATR